VFGGMQQNIARAAEEYERTGSPPRWQPTALRPRRPREAERAELTPTSFPPSSDR
jgi:hypothetical protein